MHVCIYACMNVCVCMHMYLHPATMTPNSPASVGKQARVQGQGDLAHLRGGALKGIFKVISVAWGMENNEAINTMNEIN